MYSDDFIKDIIKRLRHLNEETRKLVESLENKKSGTYLLAMAAMTSVNKAIWQLESTAESTHELIAFEIDDY